MQRFLAVVLALVVIAAGVGYLLLERRHAQELEACRAEAGAAVAAADEAAAARLRELAEDLARSVAAALAENVVRGDRAAIDDALVAVVQGNLVAGAMVVAPDGGVIAATDLRFRGRILDEATTRKVLAVDRPTVLGEADERLEVAAPIVAAAERVGVLRLFVEAEAAQGS